MLLPEQVLYEDNHLIVINKRSGQIVQGDKTGDEPLSDMVKNYLKEKYQKPGNVFVGVVHRLDRPVSGVVIFAKTSKALTRLNAMIQNREIQKIYWAIVLQKPKLESDKLVHYLIKDSEKNKSRALLEPREGYLKSVLNYQLIASSERYHLLEIELETGRHHQIRVQLKEIGCIIKGDLKYGAPRSNPDGSISLHARKIAFEHPVSKEKIEIVADVPEENLWKILSKQIK